MFGLFKKKKDKAHVLRSTGKREGSFSSKKSAILTFSEGILGDGVAVDSIRRARSTAPADGTIGMVFDTLHAISLTTRFWGRGSHSCGTGYGTVKRRGIREVM